MTTPANQRDIIRHIVERVVIRGRDVAEIIVRPEAMPFFAAFDSSCVAPPEGRRDRITLLARYA